MDYQTAVGLYTDLRAELTAIDAEAKAKKAAVKEKMNKIEAWITERAQKDGLENVKTPKGTAYWSMHYTCTVANPEAFFNFVKENEAWDLIEKRASKTAVKSFIDEEEKTPPGVNFSSYRAFNVRAS